MKWSAIRAALILICQLSLVLIIQSCQTTPAPPEVARALQQEQDLWRAGASFYAPEDYEAYRQSLTAARKFYEKEELKIGFFRNYDRVRQEFSQVLAEGERISRLIEEKKASLTIGIAARKNELVSRYEVLNNLSLELSQRALSRQQLAQADVLLREVDRLLDQARYEEARSRLDKVNSLLNQSENILRRQLERYMSQGEIARWRQLAERAVEKSRSGNQLVILVSKLERRLTVYKGGQPIKTYEVGLGFNGLSDKLHAGDNATPEGEYKVIKKVSPSKFGRALLLNYPNEDDLKRFNEAKKKGYITPGSRIGGLIEIHGGGKDGLTQGCVALDDPEMEELFRMIPVGTPVTIVGTTDPNNKIIAILKREPGDKQ
ncbi:MAG: L,D-transpeptidase family protein [Candidatus Saccharicenans sp.]|uniref:L,D-transpeptidase family protein n=1 Tax=Candidatus Saccharicenans sp. TaxID=2819258 RepID=UPI00404B8746